VGNGKKRLPENTNREKKEPSFLAALVGGPVGETPKGDLDVKRPHPEIIVKKPQGRKNHKRDVAFTRGGFQKEKNQVEKRVLQGVKKRKKKPTACHL